MAQARRQHLIRAGLRAAGVIALALLLHLLVLEWFARYEAGPPSALQAMAEPMFTRVLTPQAPPPPAPAVAVPKPPRRSRPAVSIAPAPEPAPEPASEPAAVASAPETPEAPPPEEAASQEAAPSPAAAASAPALAPAAESQELERWPRDSRITYALTGLYRGGPLYGGAEVQWQRQGALYQVRLTIDVSLAGKRILTSQGTVTPDGLTPRVYEETWRGRQRAARLEDGQMQLENGTSLPAPPEVQDTASQFVELGHRFATGREMLAVGRSIDVWLARPGGLELWTYDVAEQERLRTPHHGEVDAFRLKPRPITQPRGNVSAEIWFAPTLQYLPVRIRVSTGPDAFVDLMVDTIEQR